MFGTNEVVGPGRFAEQEKNTLLVTSIFYTLQGEGPFSGHPAVFVRLAKCNLACSFCDTAFELGLDMSFQQALETIERVVHAFYRSIPHPVQFAWRVRPLIVITGGEPFLQKNLGAFCAFLMSHSFQVQIESNGTCRVPAYLPSEVTLVVSPKVIEDKRVYFTPGPSVLNRANCLKFLIGAQWECYKDVPSFGLDWAARRMMPLYVSPINVYNSAAREMFISDAEMEIPKDEAVSFWEGELFDHAAMQENYALAARVAMRHGAILTLQSHIFAGVA